MKVKEKRFYYFEEKDTKNFEKWAVDNHITYRELATILNVSPAYLHDMIFGKRSVKQEIISWLKSHGMEI